MASLTIRGLDEHLKAKLRVQAAAHGRPMEAEVREILRTGLQLEPASGRTFAESLRRHIAPLGGVELVLPTRGPVRRAPKLAK